MKFFDTRIYTRNYKFQFHPSGNAFVTASEDKTARLWDLRADQQIASFKPPSGNPGFTCSGLSLSGRFIFCGTDDNNIHIWDTLKAQHNGIYTKALYAK